MSSMDMFLFTSPVSHKSPRHTGRSSRVLSQSRRRLRGFILTFFHSLRHRLTRDRAFKGLDLGAIFRGRGNKGLAECSPLQPGD